MGGLRRYLELQARARTGLSGGLLVWALLGAVFAILTFAFVLVSVFIWLARHYGSLTAALVLAGLFLLLAIIALICCIGIRRRNVERAQQALAARRTPMWLDPRLVAPAMQVSRSLGWGKVATLLAIGVVAAGVGAAWFGRPKADDADAQDHDEAQDSGGWFSRAA